MNDIPSVDFLKKKYKLAPDRQKTKKYKTTLRTLGVFLAFLALGGVAFSYQLAKSTPEVNSDNGSFSLFSSVKRFVTSQDKELTGEDSDRINFLLLGVGGAGHDGPELTDTIMFGSFQPSTSQVGLLSIPRDLVVPIPGYGYRKINSINAYGEQDNPGYGHEEAAKGIGELLDQKIHYVVKVDFDGFEEMINDIGGVDVYVDRSFVDYSYPTEDDLTQTISFEQGWLHMDGATALQFARSRHGTNGEGSDFARAARQQKILIAVKDKTLSAAVLLNPSKLNKLIETFENNVQTNLTFWEITKLVRYAPDITTENIHHAILDESVDSPLYSTSINGAYVLMPKRDDWSQVQEIAKNIFTEDSIGQTAEAAATLTKTNVKIEIQNGTSISGLAFQASQMLDGSGFEVVKIGNAESSGYDKTIIYDLSNGAKTTELGVLKDFLEADVAMSTAGWIYSDEVVPRELSVNTPGEDIKTADESIDFLVILGQSAESIVLR